MKGSGRSLPASLKKLLDQRLEFTTQCDIDNRSPLYTACAKE
jgi:hypothetical protein